MGKKVHRNALPVGHELHWFRIEDVLGHGGFGLTYLARDVNLDRLVAIKEYMPTQISMRESDMSIQPVSSEVEEDYTWGLNRFISEARTLTQFEHPNLVRVFNVFETNNSAYMVMNYEQGRSLREILRTGYRFSEDELAQLLFPLMDGLETVHNKGFVHRDIKPGNIFIRLDGGPVLLDFGSARQTRGGLTTRTLTNFVSPGYAPIEQYIGKSNRQGPWTDIYGLGATAYEAMTGNMPEAAIDRSAMISNESGDNLIKISLLCKGKYSRKFLAAIDHALGFNTQDRPQSIDEWRQEFGIDASKIEKLTIPEPEVDTFSIPRDKARAATELTRRTNCDPEEGESKSEVTTERHTPEPEKMATRPTVPLQRVHSRYRSAMVMIVVIGVALLGFMAYHTYWQVSREQRLSPNNRVSETGDPNTGVMSAEQSDAETGLSAEPSPKERIDALLALAGEDISALRLTSPQDNNAYDKYLRVLALDQENIDAVRGIDRITDTYLELVAREIEAGNLDKAGQYLERADYLRPGQPKITSARKELESAIRERKGTKTVFNKIRNIFN